MATPEARRPIESFIKEPEAVQLHVKGPDGSPMMLHAVNTMDSLHYFPFLEAHILKYYDTNTRGIFDVVLEDIPAAALADNHGFSPVVRETITQRELDNVISWRAKQITDDAFPNLDIDADAIEQEFRDGTAE